jgi:DnaK suppressor protein
LTPALAELVRFGQCDLVVGDPRWSPSIVRGVLSHFHRAEEFPMTAVSFIPSADPDTRAVELPRDTAVRLHALLVARRDDETALLEQLATAEEPTVIDEHAEFSATVASGTLHDVEYALSRFDAGTYGSCEVCAGAIPLERLEAIPHATTCVVCAETTTSVFAGASTSKGRPGGIAHERAQR